MIRERFSTHRAGVVERHSRWRPGPRSGCRGCRSPSDTPRRRGARGRCGAARASVTTSSKLLEVPGSMSIIAHVGRCGVFGGRRPGVQLDRPEVGRPRQRCRGVEHGVHLGLARIGVRVAPATRASRGRATVRALCQNPPLSMPSGKRCRLIGRSCRYGNITGAMHGVVADEVALGHRPVGPLGGEQHLVEVRQLAACARRAVHSTAGLAAGRRAQPSSSAVGRDPDASARPRRRRSRLDLVVGAARLHRPGMILRTPTGNGIGVVLVDQQPLLVDRPAGRVGRARTGPRASRPWRSKCRSPSATASSGIVGLGQLPRSPVPDDDVAAAVLAGGDDTLEVEVVQRVVLDVDRHPPDVGVERRSLRHRPATAAPQSASSRRS